MAARVSAQNYKSRFMRIPRHGSRYGVVCGLHWMGLTHPWLIMSNHCPALVLAVSFVEDC